MISPYRGNVFRVTSKVGYRINPVTGKGTQGHYGLDCVACGDDTVVAVKAGKVVQSRIVTTKLNATWQWGNYVAITDAYGYTIYYCHLRKRCVSVGDTVKAGQAIGLEGTTGQVTGKHLHIEQRKGASKCNIEGDSSYCNIANTLGVENATGKYTADEWKAETFPDQYSHDGFTFVRAKNFAIKYHDKNKRTASNARYINGGFFGYYDENGKYFTLPAANLKCYAGKSDGISDIARKYIGKYINNENMLAMNCNDNFSSQFKGKPVSTLVVPLKGDPYIADILTIPPNAKYAISGVPTVRNGYDVDYYNYVVKQGWDSSCMYATYRNFIGVRNGEIWIITGKTKTRNYIYGCEMWNILAQEGFEDVVALDGGGSYFYRNGSVARTTSGVRQINNIIIY